ncbi:MAG TPA: right-handed parallel beta-helix repeat-containing protein [Planctomycetota bacterium]|nr:right-handed parallel beta-helix repeat-containing protein [Planctomycetota bacterium]
MNAVRAAVAASLAIATAVCAQDRSRETSVATTAELRRALAAARPGDVLVVAPGAYDGVSVAGVRGAPGRRVTVRGADAASRPVFRGGLHFARAAHLELRDLAVEGAPANGINVDDGGAPDAPARDVALIDVVVRDVGGRDNHDGIKLSGVEDFRLERCTVERWGRKGSAVDMVGCRRGVLEGCIFRDRETDAASSGVQAKGGSRDVAIRRCRFEHAGSRAVNLGGSTGRAYFRPKPEGYEAKDLLVEECVFVGSDAPVAFVGVDGAVVRRNTFVRPRRWALRILQESRDADFAPCRGGVFVGNLTTWRAAELRGVANVGPGTAPETFRFERNWWWCEDAARGAPELPTPEREPGKGGDPKFRDAAAGDYRLAPGSPATGYGAP